MHTKIFPTSRPNRAIPLVSFVSVVGVAHAVDGPGLSFFILYYSTTAMERPPTPPGPHTRAMKERLFTPTPSHWSASPRATSASARRCQRSRRHASSATALPTPPRAGYYGPLGAATARDDGNPFTIDSEDDDDNEYKFEGSPPLLTDPAGVAGNPAGATGFLAVIAGASADSGTMTGNGSNDAVVDPPPPAAPGTTAAVMADFALLLEKHVTGLNERIDTLKAETASNHGHITKRLFPALEERFTHLEHTLATTTEALEAKGASLLAKCTALEDTVLSVVNGRVNVSDRPRRPHTLGRDPVNPRMTPRATSSRRPPPPQRIHH
jgi:hypothetical protein